MAYINPLTSIHLFKGAPLSCIMTLWFRQDPTGAGSLMRTCGYSDKTIASALRFLQDEKMVFCNGRYDSWRINMESDHFFLNSFPFLPESMRNFSDSYATATTLINNKDKEREEVVVEESLPADFSALHQMLRFAGVGEPMATNLAKLSHVTPYYVAGHYLKAKAERISVGLMIHRIKSEDPAPDLNHNYHLLGCDCLDCGHLRFSPNQGILAKGKFQVGKFVKKANSG